MATENMIKEITLEDLRKTTWGYCEEDCIGLYKDIPIMIYLFEVKECGTDRNLLTVQSCNVSEGWIEFIECSGDPIKVAGKVILPGSPKIDEDSNFVKTKISTSMVVDILDREGKVIETMVKNRIG